MKKFTMVIPAPDPLSAVSSSISATIKILEVTYQLKAVDEQTADLLSTTRHVDSMIHEAHRVRRLKAGLLNTSERTWIDRVISDTEDALRAVAKLIERCRVDKATKSRISFGHRVMWVFRDNPSVRDKHQKLQICHQSLGAIFACLYSKEVVVIAPAPEGRSEEQPPPYDPQLKELLDWQNRRKGRKSTGEREGYTNEKLGLTNGTSYDVPIAGPSSPCLLPISLEEDGEAPSLSTRSSEMTFEPNPMPTPLVQASVSGNKDNALGPTTAPPESDSHSPHVSALGSYSFDPPSATHSNARDDSSSSMPNLPEIDNPPLASMMAHYTFNEEEEEGLQVDQRQGHLTHSSSSASDPRPSSSAVAPSTTLSNPPSLPTLPFSTIEMPASSGFSTGSDLGLRWLESSRHNSFDYQEPTGASSLDQHPLPAKFNSDTQLSAAYQSDRIDALARAEDFMARENRAVSVGQGAVKRGGQSWLAYHATKSDIGRRMD